MARLYVGIDIGSGFHHAAIFTEGPELLKRWKISHCIRDISRFIEELEKLKGEHGCTEVMIGMESSNGYAAPMDRMLVHAGFKVIAINSVTIDKYRKLVGQERKDDAYDAKLIGSYLIDIYHLKGMRKHAQEIGNPGQSSTGNLRALTRHFRTTKRELTRVTNRLRKHLLGYFPDFLEVFEDLQTKTARVFLCHYGSVSKAKAARRSSIAKLRLNSRRTIGPKAAAKLKALVQEIQYVDPLEEEMEVITHDMVCNMNWLMDRLDALSERIKQNVAGMQCVQEVITHVPGAGVHNTAELLAEIGDVRRFSTREKLSIYCGIGCLNKSSGKQEGARKPVHVNHRAKGVMCMMAQSAILCDSVSRRYYDKKRSEGKSHWHAIKCLAKYLLRRIYLLLNAIEPQEFVLLVA